MALALTLALLARLTASPASPLEVRADAVDPALTEAGLRARADLQGWTITVTQGPTAHTVDVKLRAPDGSQRRRRLKLTGETAEDRSRELAASLALLMDEPGDPPAPAPSPPPAEPEPAPAEPPPPPPIRGWLALGPRVSLGTSVLAEAGVDLMGGAWLVRDHLQPIGSLGVAGATQGGVSLLHARVGAGLAAGAPLRDRRIWLGGQVLVHALQVRAYDATTAATWLSSTELGGLMQYRGQRLMFGLHTGVDLTLPPLTVQGTHARVRRGPARWTLGVVLGVAFG